MDGQITTRTKAKLPRMRGPLSRALDMIAIDGATQRDAARRAGLNENALSKAIRKPHVAAELERRKTNATLEALTLKQTAKAVAIREGIRLMTESASDAVRARMVEFFAGEAKQPLVAVQVNNAPIAGYHYPKPDAQSGASDPQVIDAQAINPDGEE